MKYTLNLAQRKSSFMAATIVPVHHTERDARFGLVEGMLALLFIFGTIGLMRLVLTILGDGP
jgi:hypothetical protein